MKKNFKTETRLITAENDSFMQQASITTAIIENNEIVVLKFYQSVKNFRNKYPTVYERLPKVLRHYVAKQSSTRDICSDWNKYVLQCNKKSLQPKLLWYIWQDTPEYIENSLTKLDNFQNQNQDQNQNQNQDQNQDQNQNQNQNQNQQ